MEILHSEEGLQVLPYVDPCLFLRVVLGRSMSGGGPKSSLQRSKLEHELLRSNDGRLSGATFKSLDVVHRFNTLLHAAALHLGTLLVLRTSACQCSFSEILS